MIIVGVAAVVAATVVMDDGGDDGDDCDGGGLGKCSKCGDGDSVSCSDMEGP